MKIHREGFLAAAMAIAAANTVGCKAKMGDDASPENANAPAAEGVGSPAQEGLQVPLVKKQGPAGEVAFNKPIAPLNAPAAESAPAGWAAPPPPPPPPTAAAAANQPGWAAPKPTVAPAATTPPGWAAPKPAPTPAPAATTKSGWTQPKKP